MVFRTDASPDHRAVETQIDDEMLAFGTELINEINWYMRERDLTRAELAERMRVSPGRVSQILSGGENLTSRTLAALSTALEARFSIELHPVKDDDTYTSSDEMRTDAAPADKHHPASRAPRRGVRPRSLSLCRPNRARPWPSRRVPYRGRTFRERIEDLAHSVDEPWCFLENEVPRRDPDPGHTRRPDAGRKHSRG